MKKLLLSLLLPVSAWAATQQSAELNGGLNQPIEHWQFSSAANRTGATGFFSQDIGKLALETDDNSYWRLTGITPTWLQIPTESSSSVTWTGSHTFRITDGVTANDSVIAILGHDSTGTPGTSFGSELKFQLQDSTTKDIDAGFITTRWSTATHGAVVSYLAFALDNGSSTPATIANITGAGGASFGTLRTGMAAGVVSVDTGIQIFGNAAPLGNRLQGDGTTHNSYAVKVNQASPANPTGTTNTTGLMMGMGLAGGDATHGGIATGTNTSGKVLIIISGTIFNATAIADGGKVQIYSGTGTAPTNGAAITGTARGGLVQYIAATTAEKAPFSLNAIATGLAASTNYWIDVSLAAITGGTATITDVSISATEL